MEKKEKFKISNILKILVFTLILLILVLSINGHVRATTELLYDDVGNLWHGIPHNGMVDGKTLWCSDKGHMVAAYMDCPHLIADLLGSGTVSSYFLSVGGDRTAKTFTMFDESDTKDVWEWKDYLGDLGLLAEKYTPIYKSASFEGRINDFLSYLEDLSNTGKVYNSFEGLKKAYGTAPGLDLKEGSRYGEYDVNRIWNDISRSI